MKKLYKTNITKYIDIITYKHNKKNLYNINKKC